MIHCDLCNKLIGEGVVCKAYPLLEDVFSIKVRNGYQVCQDCFDKAQKELPKMKSVLIEGGD